MIRLIPILLLLTISCRNGKVKSDDIFKANYPLNKVWDPVQRIVKNKDFAVVITGGYSTLNSSAKVFCRNKGMWEKIEYIGGITELDTAYSNRHGDLVTKEIVLTMECRDEDAKQFMDQLIKRGLFTLREEEDLLNECTENRQDHNVPQSDDAGTITFYIIKGNNVRMLAYYDPWQKQRDCPNKEQWDKILNIDELFKSNWYAKKHL